MNICVALNVNEHSRHLEKNIKSEADRKQEKHVLRKITENKPFAKLYWMQTRQH